MRAPKQTNNNTGSDIWKDTARILESKKENRQLEVMKLLETSKQKLKEILKSKKEKKIDLENSLLYKMHVETENLKDTFSFL